MSTLGDVDKLFALDTEVLKCPYPHFDKLREEQPVVYAPEIESYLVTRYEDIVAIARRPDAFSSIMPTGPVLARQQMETLQSLLAEDAELAEKLSRQRRGTRVLLSADPPDHGRQRRLVNRAFTPPKVKALEPRIREVAHQLVDTFAGRGSAELVHEYGVLLPLTIIAECLGVADDDLPIFKRWSDDFVAAIGNHNMSKDDLRSLLLSQSEFFVYFTQKIAERQAEPRQDLITDVVQAELDGEPLSTEEMLAMFNQFLVAGNETTTKLIASSVRLLLEQPELVARLRAEPALIPGFVEEALRLEPPVQGLWRTALEDVEVGGVAVPKGSHLMLVYAAGNRDERLFPDAATADPCRSNSMRHLAFGHGEHYCIGSALARAEGRIAIEVLLERLDDLKPAEDLRGLEYEHSYVLHGLQRLPVTFTAR
jgi:cytochrome P450